LIEELKKKKKTAPLKEDKCPGQGGAKIHRISQKNSTCRAFCTPGLRASIQAGAG
jgi:hypothetical protein